MGAEVIAFGWFSAPNDSIAEMDPANSPKALLVGTTADLYQAPNTERKAAISISESQVPNREYFRSAQWYLILYYPLSLSI